mgnify:CR=1 FL=1
MLEFKQFIAEGRGVISGSGMDAIRHKVAYLDPHVGSGDYSHELAKPHGNLEAGHKLMLNKVEDIGGKFHVHATDQHGNDHLIPASKLHKPGPEKANKGHKFESDFIDRLKHHNLMPHEIQGAGSTGGTDFVLLNKKKKTLHHGKVKHDYDLFHGETKEGVSAAMGQLTIRHTPEKGWHIPDDARAKRPQYATHIEKAGLLDYMNEHQDPDKHDVVTTASGRAKSLVFKHPNLDPANGYLQDHHVHVLHVGGGFGTYKVGDKDHTGAGLPNISGQGRWTVREKQFGNKRARTVVFQPDGKKGLNKSHINLDNDDHIELMKKSLGHND